MQLVGRGFRAGSGSYRYSINGQEKEKELSNNITSAEFWMYDSRLVRRWNVDPIIKIHESPYLCFSGNPIKNSDLKGNTSSNGTQSGPGPGAWQQIGRELSGIQKFFQKVSEPTEKVNEKAVDILNESLRGSLTTAAYQKNKDLLYFDLMGVKPPEDYKSQIFSEDADKSVGILLYEFANGTSNTDRKFNYDEQRPNSFTNQYVSGYVVDDLISGLYTEIAKKYKEGQPWDLYLNSKKAYTVSLPFSPTSNSSTWGDSFEKHKTSNSAQFFTGGAIAYVTPTSSTTADVRIYNETSRYSLMIHMATNNSIKNTPLNTISQTHRLSLVNLNESQTSKYETNTEKLLFGLYDFFIH